MVGKAAERDCDTAGLAGDARAFPHESGVGPGLKQSQRSRSEAVGAERREVLLAVHERLPRRPGRDSGDVAGRDQAEDRQLVVGDEAAPPYFTARNRYRLRLKK